MTKVIKLKGGSMISLIKEFREHKRLSAYNNCPKNEKNFRILMNEGKVKKIKTGCYEGIVTHTYEWVGD